MKVDVELEPFTPLLRPTYADAHAGAISEVRMEGYEFGHTYVWQGPGLTERPKPLAASANASWDEDLAAARRDPC